MTSFAATLVAALAFLPSALAADQILVYNKFGTSAECSDRVDMSYIWAEDSGADCADSTVACAQSSAAAGEYQTVTCESDLASLMDGKIGWGIYSDSECITLSKVFGVYQANHCYPTSSTAWEYTTKDGSNIKNYKCTTSACDIADSADCTLDATYSALYTACEDNSATVGGYTRGFNKISTATSDCFSGDDTLTLESGDAKRLSEVALGDLVQTADAHGALSFAAVVALPHAANDQVAAFVRVATASGKSLKATKMHLLQRCDGTLAYAGSLVAGDCLRTVDGDDPVAAVSVATAAGVYTAVTTNEFLVVNGIVASPFAVAHGLTNSYYHLHRAVAKIFPSALKSPLVLAANAFLGGAFLTAGGFNFK